MTNSKDAETSELPDGWTIAKLSDLAAINPRLNRSILDDTLPVTFVPMPAVDVGFGGIQRPETRQYGSVKKGYTSFITGDVIFAKITPCMENGKGGVVRGKPDEPFFGSTEFHVLRPRREVKAEWIAYFLSQEQFRRSARLKMKGSAGQLRVPTSFLEATTLPLPPANEQNRILDAIEELFTDLDAGVAALQRVQKKLKRYRAALLHAAVTGRLTADWRAKHGDGGETGSQLLERILVAHKEAWEERTLAEYENKGRTPPKGWEARYPSPTLPNISNLPELPATWCWATASQLCSTIQNGNTPKAPMMSSGTGEVPFLKVYNLTKDGSLNFEKDPTFISIETHRETLKRSICFPGDVLMNIVGPPLGKVSIVTDEHPEWNINQAIVAYRVLDGFSNELLCSLLLTESILRPLLNTSKATAGQFNISVSNSRSVAIPVPPLIEQDALLEVVSEKISNIQAMEAEVERGIRRSGRLRQAILKAAFEGKLVPQNLDDEPASELLARIQAEADAEVAAAPKRTPRKRKTTRKKTSKKETA